MSASAIIRGGGGEKRAGEEGSSSFMRHAQLACLL